MVDAFLEIMLVLARLHGWEVEDRRPAARKWVYEDVVDGFDSEDGGKALIHHVNSGDDEENGLFVRLHSWDESRKHEVFSSLVGKKVRVTVEEVR
jgi:ribulose bisphosphate carboxylase small subunit